MAVTNTPSTYFQYRKQSANIDLINDTIKAALMNSSFVFDRDKHKVFTAPSWVGSTSYATGDLIIPTTANGYVYKVTTGGTSASTEPTWPTSFGNTVTDGNGVVYECWSYDCANEEITSNGGYAQTTLANPTQVENETDHKAVITYDDIVFSASGGDFDATAGCIIYNDTDEQDIVIAGVDFGTSYTGTDENNMTLKNPQIEDISKQTSI